MTKSDKNVVVDLPLETNFPSKKLHLKRNSYQTSPVGTLISKQHNRFVDDAGNVWLLLPWYQSMFHNPAVNIKLILYDPVPSVGSSEIIVAKKAVQKKKSYDGSLVIPPGHYKMGSYNFRDFNLSSQWKHFVADILPNIVYCNCVGK